MKKQLIKKHQLGAPVAKLSQAREPKLLPNGLSGLEWLWDKVANAGNYIEDGMHWLVGAIDPNSTGKEAVQAHRDWREYHSQPQYDLGVTAEGDTIPVTTYIPPQGGIAPLPTLAAGAPARVAEAHARLVPKWRSALVRESQFKHGLPSKKGTPLEETKPWIGYKEALKNYEDELTYMDIPPMEVAVYTDKTKRLRDSKDYKKVVWKQKEETKHLGRKQKANYKSSEYMADGDTRHVGNVGRIPLKDYDYVDNLIDKFDPVLKKKMIRYKANLESATDERLRALILETINLARLLFLRKQPTYLKNVNKLYQSLETKLGVLLDKRMG